ncbi:unnamed protein product [Aphanomyces euteiches]
MLSIERLLSIAASYPFLAAIIGLVASLSGLLVYVFTIKPALSPLNSIPGPKSKHWIFGSLKEIIDTKWSKGHFPEPNLSWVKQYGGVVHYRAFLSHRVMLTDPETLKHVFNTHAENYPRSSQSRLFLRDVIGGDGLLSAEGPTHRNMRKMLLPHFGLSKVRQFFDIFQHHTELLASQLAPIADTTTSVDMFEYFTKLTLDIIGISAFGYNFGSLTNQNERVLTAYKMMNQPPSLFYGIGRQYIPGFDYLPFESITQRKEAKKILFETVGDVIAAKLHSPRSASTDLVDLILDEESQKEHKVSAEEARTHVLTFLLAGHETTSSTLCWVFTMFAQHPEMEDIARAVCKAVAAASEGGKIGWQSLGDMKYTTAFIHETLRLYPTIAGLTTREAVKDDLLPVSSGKPYFIPKGTTIAVSTGALHRNPKYWSQPDTFIPERFLEDTKAFASDQALRHGQGNTYFYMPFSTGPKKCIGMRFATAELQVVIANLLLKYSFQLAPKADVNPKQDGVSIKPVALEMTVHSISK